MKNITTRTQRAGFATVERGGKTIGHVTRDDVIGSPNFGKWEARPFHDALTVGKTFPHFATRREAAGWVNDNY